MKKIHLIKPLRYIPRSSKTQSLYDGFHQVALRLYDPDLLVHRDPTQKSTQIALCSTSLRAIQTAKSSGEVKLRNTELLNEITFDLTKLLSKKEYGLFGSTLVRDRFIEAFISDSLIESRDDIKFRITELITLIKELDQEVVNCYSHSFFMKVTEAYISSDCSLFENPIILRNIQIWYRSNFKDIMEKT